MKRLFDVDFFFYTINCNNLMTFIAPVPKPVAVDLTGAAVLELRTLSGGDGVDGDHGNWAEARLVR